MYKVCSWFGLGLLSLTLQACEERAPSRRATDGLDAGLTLLSRDELLRPDTCKSCHPKHYREWSGSMHAYAAQDPVFLAMNKRGQRETQGALGDFCVKCHAPMAVREGATRDGLNLDELPDHLKGVTCYFCHSATAIEQDHNAALTLANDTTMRGAIADPVPSSAHGVAYSALHDRQVPDSSRLCGACHDVVTPAGVHLERTLKEYQQSAFARQGDGAFLSCQGCHMDGRLGKAAQAGAATLPDRLIHEHVWAGVDVALSDFPDREAQRMAVECALESSVSVVSLTASPAGQMTVVLETEAGHAQPSGAAQDRRMWLELLAYDRAGNVVYQSGAAGDDDPEPAPVEQSADPRIDARPLVLFDRIFDAAGKEVHMFWEAHKSEPYPDGYSSQLLQTHAQFANRSTIERTYTLPGGLPERVTVRMRMRPISRVILDDLVRSGDLDPAVVKAMPTFTLYGSVVEWKRADGFKPVRAPQPSPLRCQEYRCLLDPTDPACAAR